jgi:hypothetical protein
MIKIVTLRSIVMKKRLALTGIAGMLMALGLFMAACDNGTTGNDDSKGSPTLVITNTSTNLFIKTIVIRDRVTNNAVETYNGSPVSTGGKCEFSLPNGQYDIYLTDDTGQGFTVWDVPIFTNQTKNMVWNGWNIN